MVTTQDSASQAISVKQRNPVHILVEVLVGEKERGRFLEIQIRVYQLVSQQGVLMRSCWIAYNWYGYFPHSPSPLVDLIYEVGRCDPNSLYVSEHGFFSTHAREPHFPGEVLVRAINGKIIEIASDIDVEAAKQFKGAFTYDWP